jgi:hypothetical protein
VNNAKSAAILGVVNSALALLLAFGVSVSDAQQVAIVGIVNAVLVLVAAWRDPSVSAVGPNE